MSAFAVEGVLRRYDWGSTTAIPRLLGIEPDGRPAAELWFGAHPDDPSDVPERGRSLAELIAAEPDRLLGADVVARFGARLPYLLKILAAGKALSIQVHPDLARARAGFAAEDAAGVPRDSPRRNYRDANHKPELICALTPFEALCGFRPVAETLRLLDELSIPSLDGLRDLLAGPDGLRTGFTHLLTLEDPGPLVEAVLARAAAAPDDPRLRAASIAGADFPGDVGVVLALLLNHVRLAPGEAIYLGAGNVHAYLRGMGIEIMANSDNVLRCGLTPKHVDVAELLKITDFGELAAPRWPGTPDGFAVPVRDFRLIPLDVVAEAALPAAGPRIVLCTDGTVQVDGVALAPGRAAFVPATGASVTLGGAGRAFVAAVGAT